MIAGETEMLLADHIGDDAYDEFLFFGNKEERAKRRAARKARRAKRKAKRRVDRSIRKQNKGSFFSKLGEVYNDLGGGAAIGGAIDTIIRKPDPIPVTNTPYPQQTMDTPSDFSVNVGGKTVFGNDIRSRQNRTQNTPVKKDHTSTIIIVAGAVFLVSIVGLAIYQNQKGKYVKIKQN